MKERKEVEDEEKAGKELQPIENESGTNEKVEQTSEKKKDKTKTKTKKKEEKRDNRTEEEGRGKTASKKVDGRSEDVIGRKTRREESLPATVPGMSGISSFADDE